MFVIYIVSILICPSDLYDMFSLPYEVPPSSIIHLLWIVIYCDEIQISAVPLCSYEILVVAMIEFIMSH